LLVRTNSALVSQRHRPLLSLKFWSRHDEPAIQLVVPQRHRPLLSLKSDVDVVEVRFEAVPQGTDLCCH